MNTEILEVSMDLIDEPRIAMRTDKYDDSIDELARSIAEHGLLQPIVLRPVNARYEIIAGHRRFLAHRILNKATIRSIVSDVEAKEAEILKMHENLLRREVDPVDEACFIGETMKAHDFGVQEMADMIGRGEQYVKDRLEVFVMPEFLQGFLKSGQISLGAALWLNRIEDEASKRYYINWASQNSASVTTAKRWCLELNSKRPTDAEQREQILVDGVQQSYAPKMVLCVVCNKGVALTEADTPFVHRNFSCTQKAS